VLAVEERVLLLDQRFDVRVEFLVVHTSEDTPFRAYEPALRGVEVLGKDRNRRARATKVREFV
jgi:hypothetical protein